MVDLKPTLYVVNTVLSPGFLDMDFAAEHPERAMAEHAAFVRQVREQHPTFALPYLALFADGWLQIPYPGSLSGSLMGNIRDGMTNRQPLDEFIARYAEGKDTIWLGKTIPLTAIIEFSPTELYPAPMERLGAKYELRRITVN